MDYLRLRFAWCAAKQCRLIPDWDCLEFWRGCTAHALMNKCRSSLTPMLNNTLPQMRGKQAPKTLQATHKPQRKGCGMLRAVVTGDSFGRQRSLCPLTTHTVRYRLGELLPVDPCSGCENCSLGGSPAVGPTVNKQLLSVLRWRSRLRQTLLTASSRQHPGWLCNGTRSSGHGAGTIQGVSQQIRPFR